MAIEGVVVLAAGIEVPTKAQSRLGGRLRRAGVSAGHRALQLAHGRLQLLLVGQRRQVAHRQSVGHRLLLGVDLGLELAHVGGPQRLDLGQVLSARAGQAQRLGIIVRCLHLLPIGALDGQGLRLVAGKVTGEQLGGNVRHQGGVVAKQPGHLLDLGGQVRAGHAGQVLEVINSLVDLVDLQPVQRAAQLVGVAYRQRDRRTQCAEHVRRLEVIV